jgi:hypothetical protein
MTKMNFVLAGLLLVGSAMAQAPAGAPAGATGICKDGTYSTAPSKSGACSGHKGVQTWYAAAPAKPAAAASTASVTPAPAPKAGPAATAAAKTAAPGGGPGLVWLNTGDNVYHCNGDAYYGKTKAGAYMSEADAKTKGGRPAGGKACSK